jgi:hypothetical protein
MTTADRVEAPRVTRIRTSAACALVLALLAASAWARSGQDVRFGPASALGQGTVRTYLIVDGSGKPAELGVAVSEVAMATLPDLSNKSPMEAFLSMDLEVPKRTPSPFKLVGFFWRPLGHPPAHIYDVPHFEFHFYLIDAVTRNAILPGKGDTRSESGPFVQGPFAERASRAPAAGSLPATYAYSAGSAMPMMGGHWIDRQSQEFHGHPFDRTLVYGTWDGKVIFMQPMITRAFIQSKPQGTYEIPRTEKVPAPGWYPSAYTVKYEESAKEYRIGLVGFAKRR